MSECWHGTRPMERCEHCEAEREDSEQLIADRARLDRMQMAIERETQRALADRRKMYDLLAQAAARRSACIAELIFAGNRLARAFEHYRNTHCYARDEDRSAIEAWSKSVDGVTKELNAEPICTLTSEPKP